MKKALKRKNPYGVKVTGDGFGASFTTTVVLSLTTTSAEVADWAWAAAGSTASSAAAPRTEILLIGMAPSWRAGVARVPRQEAAGIYDVRTAPTVKPR